MSLEVFIWGGILFATVLAALLAWESVLKTDHEIREIIRKHGNDDETNFWAY